MKTGTVILTLTDFDYSSIDGDVVVLEAQIYKTRSQILSFNIH